MTISAEIQKYYEQELLYVRQSLSQFSAQYPTAAQNLGLNSDDPDISRLIDGMALLMANTQHRLDQQMPQVADALVRLIYPPLKEITPSFACAKLVAEQEAMASLTSPVAIPKGIEFEFVNDKENITMVSTSPMTIYPYQIVDTAVEMAPFYQEPPAAAHQASAKIAIELNSAQQFEQVSGTDFEFYIQSEQRGTDLLIDHLLNQCLAITLTTPENDKTIQIHANRLNSRICDPDLQLLPYAGGQFSGLDMLRDLLIFPDKARFFTVKNLGNELSQINTTRVTVNIFLKQLPSHILHLFDPQLFALNVVPLINRFNTTAEPVIYDFSQLSVPVLASARVDTRQQIINIHQVTELTHLGEQTITELFAEHFSTDNELRWQSKQHLSPAGQWQTQLSLTMPESAIEQEKLLQIELVCCQGDLPCELQLGERALVQPEIDLPGKLQLVSKPTAPRYPQLESQSQWQLINLLGTSLSNLLEHPKPHKALEQIIELIAPQQQHALNATIVKIEHHHGIKPVFIGAQALFVTGTDIEITLTRDSQTGLISQLLNGFYQQFCRFDRYISVTVKQQSQQNNIIQFPMYTPWERQ